MTKLEKITLGLIGSLVLLMWLAALPFLIQAWS
jgi:hypothetical protein